MLGSQPMLMKQIGQQRFAFTLHTSEKSSDYSLKSRWKAEVDPQSRYWHEATSTASEGTTDFYAWKIRI